jgi:hypothetical protein
MFKANLTRRDDPLIAFSVIEPANLLHMRQRHALQILQGTQA